MTVEYSVGKTQVENSRRGGEGGSTKPDWRDSGGVPLSNQLLTIESMLQVSGDGVMLGYLNNPEANAKTFTDDRWGRITIMITNIDHQHNHNYCHHHHQQHQHQYHHHHRQSDG